uniref:Thioredoxin n=1 Tax=Poecilia latipinna TaxID=48699 RepID=A0A3B3UXB1_9TELE
MVKFVKTLEEFNDILSTAGNKLVVVDFTATWCGPCRRIGPVFEVNVIFLKVDVDEASDVSQKCEIRSMPTFHFYKNGKKVDEFTGANEKLLMEKIKQLRQ